MNIEYEATYPRVDKDEARATLKAAGASLIKQEFLMKRVTFNLPAGHEIPGGWLRVRDEGDKITMSLKAVTPGKIEDQKEIQLVVGDFQKAADLLTEIGCVRKAYQESKRELWTLGGVEITIDEWPYLEPFVEVEGPSEDAVKSVSQQIGFDYGQAMFCSVETLYSQKYGLSEEYVCNNIPEIVFDGQNPFIR